MITIEKSLKHMAWSNQKIFAELSTFPGDIYFLRATEGEWPVGKILNHFIGSAEWYRFLLTEKPWRDNPKITNAQTLLELQEYLAELDDLLLKEASNPDSEITFKGEDGNLHRTSRSLVLSQSVSHAAEHKGQLATILKIHGYQLNLDRYDLWSYEAQ